MGGRGAQEQLETMLAAGGTKSCEVLKIKHYLLVQHLFLLPVNETACLVFPPEFRLVTVPPSQCHSHSEK